MTIDKTVADRIRANVENDLFAKDANLDLRGFILPTLNTDDGTDPWLSGNKNWLHLSEFGAGEASARLKKFLGSREAIQEAARFDPDAATRYAEERSEEIALEFCEATPAYYRTDENYVELVSWLARKYLGKDYLDLEEATLELTKRGYFTVESLAQAFHTLTAEGRLQPQPGRIKELTEQEELKVISDIVTKGPAAAVINFIGYSLGTLPALGDVSEFISRNAAVASRASLFVWRHMRYVDDNTFNRFEPTLRNQKLLTVPLIDAQFSKWETKNIVAVFEEEAAAAQPSAKNLEDMTDAEIADLMRKMRRR